MQTRLGHSSQEDTIPPLAKLIHRTLWKVKSQTPTHPEVTRDRNMRSPLLPTTAPPVPLKALLHVAAPARLLEKPLPLALFLLFIRVMVMMVMKAMLCVTMTFMV